MSISLTNSSGGAISVANIAAAKESVLHAMAVTNKLQNKALADVEKRIKAVAETNLKLEDELSEGNTALKQSEAENMSCEDKLKAQIATLEAEIKEFEGIKAMYLGFIANNTLAISQYNTMIAAILGRG